MEKPSPLIAEFVGTFFLTFTIGCNGLEGAPSTWAPTSAAFVLMSFVYAFGEISGAYFNPAINVAAALSGKLSWQTAGAYAAAQVAGAMFASLVFDCLYAPQQQVFAPRLGIFWWVCMIVEVIYTAMLALVFLNVRSSGRNNPVGNSNQFHGLAIGLVMLAGCTVCKDISAGIFNPAVAFGLDLAGFRFGVYWGFVYSCWHIIGACLAALLFRLVRPEDFRGLDATRVQQWRPAVPTRLACEFVGTFSLMFSAGLGTLMRSQSVAWAVAATLLSMSYSLSDVSGGHFNPAVTIAVALSGRNFCGPVQAIGYCCFQCVAAVLAALLVTGLRDGDSFSLSPKDPFTMGTVFAVELIFTYFVVLVYLGTLTVPGVPSRVGRNFYFGLAVSMAVMTGTLVGSSISGSGWLNPALSLGVATANTLNRGDFTAFSYDITAEILAAAMATLTFFVTHGDHFQTKPKPV